jgi:hypothetical protein
VYGRPALITASKRAAIAARRRIAESLPIYGYASTRGCQARIDHSGRGLRTSPSAVAACERPDRGGARRPRWLAPA